MSRSEPTRRAPREEREGRALRENGKPEHRRPEPGRQEHQSHENGKAEHRKTAGSGIRPNLLIGATWAALLLTLWLCDGRDLAGGSMAQLPTTGDIAAVGRPHARPPAPARHRVAAAPAAEPTRITIAALGLRAAIAARGRDGNGVLTPVASSPSGPPAHVGPPAPIGWYAAGPRPGEPGAAVLTTGPDSRTTDPTDPADLPHGTPRAARHRLTGIRPGDRIDIQRSDGTTAQFTVEEIQVYDLDRLTAHTAYTAHRPGRSELRLITHVPAGNAARGHPAPVVISAYLSGIRPAPHT
ncbi:class F sortase [Streptomyces sp. GS7]|uniref:class F sortase n=1 Tax=Streptomyces sp. GS7 TaxID=2692234 RepID=UPI00131908E1|nr:class F sortase [Streptomyces sp. GS7]QHC20920.1 class F sortase [Streptomyces sp. GS7]